ncbi:hypothetical protein [Photorhabdus sp. MH8.4]
MTGVSECSQQRGNLKDDGYISIFPCEKLTLIIYPMDFKMHRDGKGVNPREHR